MFAFLKGVVVGLVLAFVVAGLIGHAGGTGGILHVRHMAIQGFRFYWSWALFVFGTGLGWFIFLLLE
jgi:hypothetical protein